MPPVRSFPDVTADIAALFGLSRPAGQCFAAIWRAAQAPNADDLSASLGLSRSNVSTALKELREWGLINRARRLDDRKEYFTAAPDPWDTLRVLMAGQARRRIAPVLDRLLETEAATGDVRIATLHSVLSAVAAQMEALAALEASELAEQFQNKDAAGGSAAPKKKKKKKKG